MIIRIISILLQRLTILGYKNFVAIGFIIITSLMIATSYFSVSRMNKNSDLLVESMNLYGTQTSIIRRMSQATFNRSKIMVEMFHQDDPFALVELQINFNIETTRFAKAREELIQSELNKPLLSILGKQGKLSKESALIQQKVIKLVKQGREKEAETIFYHDALPVQKQVFDIIEDLSKNQELSAQNSYQTLKVKINEAFSTMMIFDGISIFIAIILAFYISYRQRMNDKKLTILAQTDVLTGLINRDKLIDNIQQHIQAKPDSLFTVIFFDIDYFKSINDNFGHAIGDRVLIEFSNTIRSRMKNEDILSRFGGDEFVLFLRSATDEKQIQAFIYSLSSTLDTSFALDSNEVFISSSIGASLYPQDAKTPKLLLKNADIAMYSAKEAGRNCFKFYSKESNEKLEKKHTICHALHSVLKGENINKELSLKYQPLLNLNNDEITECEALIRWTNAEGIEISANEFIPLAEKNHLIEKINCFVIDEACQQQREWQDMGIDNIRININLSGNKTIFKKQLIHFKDKISELNLKPSQFGIELTERMLYEVLDKTIIQLKEMRNLGMKISIDDFGTGYSSLSFLKKLPITTLKIDQEFIAGLPDDKDDQALVRAIITLGHSLNLNIVAEGVETNEQLEFLSNSACNSIQGYYFHRPLESQQLSKLKLVA